MLAEHGAVLFSHWRVKLKPGTTTDKLARTRPFWYTDACYDPSWRPWLPLVRQPRSHRR